MRNDNKVDIEGYTDIQQEIEILQKYSLGRTSEKGQVSQIIDRLHPKTLQLQVSRVLKETESKSITAIA